MMDRSVRRKISDNVTGDDTITTETTTTSLISPPLPPPSSAVADFTTLPDDTLLHVFSLLNLRDRANLAETCRHCWQISTAASLWHSLDLRPYRFDAEVADAISRRCSELAVLRFRGYDADDAVDGDDTVGAAHAVVNLRARNLREISGEKCQNISVRTLSVIVARHELLETLILGPESCRAICSDFVRTVAICCPKLRKLWLSGATDIDNIAIEALAKYCVNLIDLGFIDCRAVDGVAITNVNSLRYLSVAGTSISDWPLVSELWTCLPNLVGLDVSRTYIDPAAVSRMLSHGGDLRVLCAINCSFYEKNESFMTMRRSNVGCFSKGKLLISNYSDVCEGIGFLFADDSMKGKNAFLDWRDSELKDGELAEIMTWLEWILSHTLLKTAKSNISDFDEFWVSQGIMLLVSLMKSSQEDVQERAVQLVAFLDIDDEGDIAEPFLGSWGVKHLLRLASSCSQVLQAKSTKAIAKLSLNAKFAKAIADEGGSTILVNLARSMNRRVAQEAAKGLMRLSMYDEHKDAIEEAGGVKALIDLIFKWLQSQSDGYRILECAAAALANLAVDNRCSVEVAAAGGITALVMLARTSYYERVQKEDPVDATLRKSFGDVLVWQCFGVFGTARALSNLTSHGDSNTNNSVVGQEPNAFEALFRLTHSHYESVREEAAYALWNLFLDDHSRDALAAAGGVEALVALAQSCSSASPCLQETVAGALWALSDSEAISIAIGQEGGVAPLITFARSEAENVHKPAVGALWKLAFIPGNALCILEKDGVSALVHVYATSVSKLARFMAALALAIMFDGSMDEVVRTEASSESISIYKSLDDARRVAFEHIEAFLLTFYEPMAVAAAATSSDPDALTHASKAAQIEEAADLLSSAPEIGRFVSMLSNQSSTLKACAAFALFQLTLPDGCHAQHHANLVQNAGATRPLRFLAAAENVPLTAKVFAKMVLRNLSFLLDVISL